MTRFFMNDKVIISTLKGTLTLVNGVNRETDGTCIEPHDSCDCSLAKAIEEWDGRSLHWRTYLTLWLFNTKMQNKTYIGTALATS
jgi:hypothetical protein